MMLLAAVVAAPTLSAAQDAGSATDPAVTVPTAPAAPAPPADPAQGAAYDQQVAGQADSSATAPQTRSAPKAKVAATKTVTVGDNFYSPATITITAGDTVTWKNTGAAVHTATAKDNSFNTGSFNGGQSRSETFTSAATIPYYCTIHGQVQSGTIKVLAASSGGGGGSDGGGGSGGGGVSTSSGTSEATAVSSPDAGGSSSSLPSTGFAAGSLALLGLILLVTGTALGRIDPDGRRRIRFYSIY
jgi:plastocyanin